MGNIETLVTFSAGQVISSADVNQNFADIRSGINTYAVLTDKAATIDVAHTYSLPIGLKFSAWADGSIGYVAAGDGSITQLPIGTAGQLLQVNAGATAPEWTSDPAPPGTLAWGGGAVIASSDEVIVKGGAEQEITGVPEFTAGFSAGTTFPPHASALVEMASTTKGLLPPRMTTSERDAIPNPATGLFIYNTTSNAYQYYDGSAWANVSAAGATWDKLADTELSSDAATIDITGLSTSYKVFRVNATLISDSSAFYKIRFNGDTGTNYYWSYVYRRDDREGADSTDDNEDTENPGDDYMKTSRSSSSAMYLDLVIMKLQSSDPASVLVRSLSFSGLNSSTYTRLVCRWDNTTDLLDQITFLIGPGGTYYKSGSHVQVFGRVKP